MNRRDKLTLCGIISTAILLFTAVYLYGIYGDYDRPCKADTVVVLEERVEALEERARKLEKRVEELVAVVRTLCEWAGWNGYLK